MKRHPVKSDSFLLRSALLKYIILADLLKGRSHQHVTVSNFNN